MQDLIPDPRREARQRRKDEILRIWKDSAPQRGAGKRPRVSRFEESLRAELEDALEH